MTITFPRQRCLPLAIGSNARSMPGEVPVIPVTILRPDAGHRHSSLRRRTIPLCVMALLRQRGQPASARIRGRCAVIDPCPVRMNPSRGAGNGRTGLPRVRSLRT